MSSNEDLKLKANCQTLSNFKSATDVSLGRLICCEDMTIFLFSHEISSMTFGVFFVIGVNTTRVIKKILSPASFRPIRFQKFLREY